MGSEHEQSTVWEILRKELPLVARNDVGWTVMVMAEHEQARAKTKRSNDSQRDNKEALYRYIYCDRLDNFLQCTSVA